ncbi:MAG: transporter, partial [Calditrichales bacterium]
MKNLVITSFLLCAFIRILYAQEIEPRAYSNIPVNLNAAGFAYSLSHGSVITDATLPLKDLEVTTHIPTIFYMRTFSFLGKLGRMQVTVPFAQMAGDVKIAGRDTSGTRTGFADARVRFGLNLFGSPPLPAKGFQGYEQTTIIGASVVVSVPIGQYDDTKLINIGSNRWGFKPEIGVSHQYDRLYFEMYAGIWFSTTNHDFLQTSTLRQDPIFSFQWHAIYALNKGIWLAIDGAHVNGGKTKVNGVYSDSFQRNWRLGGTCSMALGKQHTLKILYHSGVATKFGGDFNIIT